MSVPLLDLGQAHGETLEEAWDRVRGVAESQAFVLCETVAAFERALADFHGVTHAVGLNSGTDALELQLRAMRIGEGDFPEAERAAREVISLPVFPELTEAERREVADAVDGYYR